MKDALLRDLIPVVLGILVRRGADFAAAEDAVQDAVVEALRSWPADPPRDPKGWLITVAWRRFLDTARADTARRRREDLTDSDPQSGPVPEADDTLRLYFLCAHPSLPPASAVALTLRAVGGLTTRQIAAAHLVPESTTAQRISRAKKTIAGVRLDKAHVTETDWVQIVEWYDELARLTDSPVVRLNRAVAVGEADGPHAGLAALSVLDPALPRYQAVAAHLHERAGDRATAARLYAIAARQATNTAERDHLNRRAADVTTRPG